MIKTVLGFSFSFICLLVCSCNPNIEEEEIKLQPDIVNNPVYKRLSQQKDYREFTPDTTTYPKTSDVSYHNNRNRDINDTTLAKFNNCHMYIDSDTLRIDIGMSSGFGGSGFNIICVNNKYNIEPYTWSDAIPIGKPHIPIFKVIKQNLVLNRIKYSLGDSIFGKVNFKIIEDEKITHIGKGYFRGKIEKPRY